MLNSAENKGIGMDPLKRAAETVGVMGLRIRSMDVSRQHFKSVP